MAITTAANVLTEVLAHFRGEDTTTAESYIAIAIDRLCYDLPILKNKFSLKLTAGTSEYSFGSGSPWYTWGTSNTATTATVIRIESAWYLDSSSAWRRLDPTSTQKLDTENETWRYQDSSSPYEIYTQSDSAGALSIGVFPTPDTTSDPATGAGYPRMDFTTWHTFSSGFAGTATIPSCIRNPLVLVYGALYAIDPREGASDGESWRAKYHREKGILSEQLMSNVKGYRPNIVNAPRAPRTV